MRKCLEMCMGCCKVTFHDSFQNDGKIKIVYRKYLILVTNTSKKYLNYPYSGDKIRQNTG